MTADTICAVATPAGRGGVSIVRLSGPDALSLAQRICGQKPEPRYAEYCSFKDSRDRVIDQGLLLYFKSPHSFTGEDVCELHTHGSPVVTDLLLKQLCEYGARLARPGEFSERAFLNDRIDLAQAEAISDLINSASESAARFAMRSLQGEFSALIDTLVAGLTSLRIYTEAALDFPDEEVDFLSEGAVSDKAEALLLQLDRVIEQARQGSLLQEGVKVAIAGEPNAGKSTLLNCLSGEEHAIVTDIPGTTRDILRQSIQIDGLPVHILDTAGLRDSDDPVEQEGIRRAWKAIREADLIMLVCDARRQDSLQESEVWKQLSAEEDLKGKLLLVLNKIDLCAGHSPLQPLPELPAVSISARTGLGMESLLEQLKQNVGYLNQEEGGFIARRRHLTALQLARRHLTGALELLQAGTMPELVAEELKQAQNALGEITGKVSSDELLGHIFSSFCIGK